MLLTDLSHLDFCLIPNTCLQLMHFYVTCLRLLVAYIAKMLAT